MKNKKIKFITETAVILALLVVLQYVTSMFGQQLITGSVVNFIIVAACLLVGFKSAVIASIISPFMAKLFGIGPAFIQILPFIAISNAVYAASYAVLNKILVNKYFKWGVSIPVGAAIKYLAISFSVTKLVLPSLSINDKQMEMLTNMFTLPQLITALIGGIIAMLVVPIVSKALSKNKNELVK